jgi:hypothetical protein
MTLAEILATFPVGSNERLDALAAWRQAEDERLAQNPAPVKIPSGKRQARPPLVPVETTPHVPSSDERRREWEGRKANAERQRETEAAAAIRARVVRAVELTCERVNALPDMSTRREKMARLAELQASLAANRDPKALAVISRAFSEIEARLARLTAE